MGDRGAHRSAVPTRVALVGCGAIGSAADEERAPQLAPLTHAGAVSAHPTLRLVAVCDASAGRAQEAGERWSVSPARRFSSVDAMLGAVLADVLVVATPSSVREPVISAACEAGVRRLVIEKPVAPTLEEALHLRRLLAQHQVEARVAYLRRYPWVMREIARRIRSGALGTLRYAAVHYGKGFANNGTHVVDLLAWLIGAPVQVEVAGVYPDDRAGTPDPTYAATVRFKGDDGTLVPATFLPGDHRELSLFEVDLVGSAGRLRLTERGQRVELSRVGPDPDFPGYTSLHPAALFREAAVDGMVALWADVAAGAPPACTFDDGLAALAVVEAARLSARTGRRAAVHMPRTSAP